MMVYRCIAKGCDQPARKFSNYCTACWDEQEERHAKKMEKLNAPLRRIGALQALIGALAGAAFFIAFFSSFPKC